MHGYGEARTVSRQVLKLISHAEQKPPLEPTACPRAPDDSSAYDTTDDRLYVGYYETSAASVNASRHANNSRFEENLHVYRANLRANLAMAG